MEFKQINIKASHNGYIVSGKESLWSSSGEKFVFTDWPGVVDFMKTHKIDLLKEDK